MTPRLDLAQLLGRPPVALDDGAIGDLVRGARVLVTGAAGSIGSELCRQLCRYAPEVLALVDRSEDGMFWIHRELQRDFPAVQVEPLIADCGDAARMSWIMSTVRPALVVHAAAYKHVPMMETCPGEALKNNVFATQTVASLAGIHGAERFVLVSTDKAVNPASVMGATKHLAEMYVQALAASAAQHGVIRTRFMTVRFGNVLGSAGSVVPIFLEQIAAGGPVTVTDERMVRYFMTIPEAAGLVLQAATLGKGGELFILDMGKPVRIVDLACDLLRLTSSDAQIAFTGARPGEKLAEDLVRSGEGAEPTPHPGILVSRAPAQHTYDEMVVALRRLRELVQEGDSDRIRARLLTLDAEAA